MLKVKLKLQTFYINWIAIFQIFINHSPGQRLVAIPQLYPRVVIQYHLGERLKDHFSHWMKSGLLSHFQLFRMPTYEAQLAADVFQFRPCVVLFRVAFGVPHAMRPDDDLASAIPGKLFSRLVQLSLNSNFARVTQFVILCGADQGLTLLGGNQRESKILQGTSKGPESHFKFRRFLCFHK